jgi:hypothetical protein
MNLLPKKHSFIKLHILTECDMISQPKWLHGTARIVPQKEVLFSYLFVLFSPVPAISTLLLATVYEHIHLRQPNRMQGDVFSDLVKLELIFTSDRKYLR